MSSELPIFTTWSQLATAVSLIVLVLGGAVRIALSIREIKLLNARMDREESQREAGDELLEQKLARGDDRLETQLQRLLEIVTEQAKADIRHDERLNELRRRLDAVEKALNRTFKENAP